MFRNYFKTAWRNIGRNKVYSVINITGIAIGLAVFWLIALYVSDELSYDRSFTNANRIYRITQHATWEGGNIDFPLNPPLLGPSLAEKFPEVEQTVRIDAEGGGVIKFNDKIIKQGDIFFADNSFFKVFDHTFLYGNAGSALAQPNTMVITESFAKKIPPPWKLPT